MSAINAVMGKTAQILATLRHDIKVPNKNIKNVPKDIKLPLYAFSVPRIDGSLFKYNKRSAFQ